MCHIRIRIRFKFSSFDQKKGVTNVFRVLCEVNKKTLDWKKKERP